MSLGDTQFEQERQHQSTIIFHIFQINFNSLFTFSLNAVYFSSYLLRAKPITSSVSKRVINYFLLMQGVVYLPYSLPDKTIFCFFYSSLSINYPIEISLSRKSYVFSWYCGRLDNLSYYSYWRSRDYSLPWNNHNIFISQLW